MNLRHENSADEIDNADRPTTSSRVRTVQTVQRNNLSYDDGSYLLAFYDEDKLCLSIDHNVYIPRRSEDPRWFTDTIISAFFIVKVFVEHSKRPNHDNIVLVNPLIWRDMSKIQKQIYDKKEQRMEKCTWRVLSAETTELLAR